MAITRSFESVHGVSITNTAYTVVTTYSGTIGDDIVFNTATYLSAAAYGASKEPLGTEAFTTTLPGVAPLLDEMEAYLLTQVGFEDGVIV